MPRQAKDDGQRMMGDSTPFVRRIKAVAPEITIQNIRGILSRIGIFVIESQWFREKDSFISLGLSMTDTPLSSNGKGTDERFALASAYAEFIERLQNLILVNGNLFTGNQPIEEVRFSDARPFKFAAFRREHPTLLAKWFEFDDANRLAEIFSRSGRRLHAYPYYNLAQDSVDYLPLEILVLAIGSNGMCAGNTVEEALIQGLCEVFERFVLRLIHTDKSIRLPLIPDEYLKSLPAWKYIQLVRDKGFEVIVKDCSLGGTMPATGVLLIKNGKAQFNLGASPDFAIALERSFTEMFQGSDFSSIDQKLQPVADLDGAAGGRLFSDNARRPEFDYFLALRSATGAVPQAIFDHTQPFKAANLFHSSDVISRRCLRRLINDILRKGYEIYLRDVSFLGFPTYQVYIPGMSEVIRLDLKDLEWQLIDLPKARKAFFNLDACGPQETGLLIRTIERLLRFPYLDPESHFQKLHNLQLRGDTILNKTELENVLYLLYFKNGDVRSAHRVLENYLRRKLADRFDNPPATAINHFCLLRFFDLLAEGHGMDGAREILYRDFDQRTVDPIERALRNLSNLPQYLGIPKCDDCAHCSFRPVCVIDPLRKLVRRLQHEIRQADFDHTKIGEHLHSILDL